MTGTSAPEQRTLGLLGGTFNPPHLGHLAIARHAREQLGLERVWLMPAGTPSHKQIEHDLRQDLQGRIVVPSVRQRHDTISLGGRVGPDDR